AIGNKGIGFKSTFSIAKNQDEINTKFPSRYVDIYTDGEFINQIDSTSKDLKCAFRLFEMIRDAEFISDLKLDKIALQSKIDSARKEYSDAGIPGYYFPVEIDWQNNTFVHSLFEKYVTVIAIPLEEPSEISDLVKENITESGIHFNFIQLRFQQEFNITVEIEGFEHYNETIKLAPDNLISCKVNNEELKRLAEAANIEIEDVSVAIVFR